MTKIVFAVLAAFALQISAGAVLASQDALKAGDGISNPVASCCGAGKDKNKDKESRKDSKSVVSSSDFRAACGGSCDWNDKDGKDKKEPKAMVACGGDKDKKDKDSVKQPKAVMACGGSCDWKDKDGKDKKEPKAFVS